MERDKFQSGLVKWMIENEFVVGIHPSDAVSEMKKQQSVISFGTTALGLFISAPALTTIKIINWMDSFTRSSKEEIREILTKMGQYCNILGSRCSNGVMMTVIYGDDIILSSLISIIDKQLKIIPEFRKIVPMSACAITLLPLLVFFDSRKCNVAFKETSSHRWFGAGAMVYVGFVDCQRKIVEYPDRPLFPKLNDSTFAAADQGLTY